MSLPATGDGAPNPKQIVFLFMAATVVAVVVFLCGVLVGRGVPLPGRGTAAAATGSGHEDVPPATLGLKRSEPSAAAAESEDLSYYRILTRDSPSLLETPESSSDEPTARPAEEPRVEAGGIEENGLTTSAAPGRASEPSPEPPATANADTTNDTGGQESDATSTPPADGYYVQVVALRETHSVNGVVARLRARGLSTIVLEPNADEPIELYRIRVGPYTNRAEAERVRQRIQTEDQFTPFVIR